MVVAAAIPIFVAALAVASFMNGFWMVRPKFLSVSTRHSFNSTPHPQSVGGYFIRAVNLPRFWYYWAHFIDFQTYAFDLLTYNDFHGLTLSCSLSSSDGSCFCDYPSSILSSTGECALAGDDVLRSLGIEGISFGLYAAILVIVALVFRVLLYVVLVFRRR